MVAGDDTYWFFDRARMRMRLGRLTVRPLPSTQSCSRDAGIAACLVPTFEPGSLFYIGVGRHSQKSIDKMSDSSPSTIM